MTLCEFFGCAFIGFGPAIAMLTLTIAQDPVLVIIVFGSGFFWLLSSLVSSGLWLLIGLTSMAHTIHLVLSVTLSVLCQEGFRYLLYLTMKMFNNGLNNMFDSNVVNWKMMSYAAGVGFGVMSGVFSVVNVLADAVGPATVGLKTGSDKFLLASASLAFCFVLLHVFWSVIFFHAVDTANFAKISWVIVTHLLASTLTLLNTSGHYSAVVIPNYVIVLLTAGIAFRAAGGTLNSLKSSFSPRIVVRCHESRSLEQNRKIARERLLTLLDNHINGEDSVEAQIKRETKRVSDIISEMKRERREKIRKLKESVANAKKTSNDSQENS
ncbi:Gamma-secretase subunit Aph-1 [Frankliniella fusca]|uniref:Gamma-secretase subunit Aph-1 n=1 Tax=Frankliniella fusca TaxID=407009 RepID=A0AAE1GUK6_9NEOP|nr:Gamma-secretase subunit Aph-1 [Frankliniella fusca]